MTFELTEMSALSAKFFDISNLIRFFKEKRIFNLP